MVVAFATVEPVFAQAPGALPPEAHGRLPYIELAQISPDGKRVAFVRQFAGIKSMTVYEVGKPRWGGFESAIFSVERFPPPAPPLHPEDLFWVGNGEVLVRHSVTFPPQREGEEPSDYSGLLLYDRLDGLPFYAGRKDLWAGFVGLGYGDGPLLEQLDKRTVFVGPYDTTAKKAGQRLDSTPLAGKKAVKRIRWEPGPDGRILTRHVLTLPPQPSFEIQVRSAATPEAPWRTVWSAQGEKPDFTPLGFADDPRLLLGLVEGPGRRLVVAALDLETGAIGEPIFAAPDVDVDGAFKDLYSDKLVGFRYADDVRRVHWLDPELAKLEAFAASRFPGERVTLDSWSRDRMALLVQVEGRQNAGAVWALRVDDETMDKIGDLYPAVPSTALATVGRYTYRTGDGQEVSGYLTLPPGRTASNLPLIIMPHGGPAARDVDQFDWWAQALAARGYAVLQPNFRGSSGFGRDFEEAGERQWGRRMQEDLTDGVKALTDSGVADPARVCIVGASYGGYAALAGATLTPTLYRCAISVAGVSDLPAMIDYSRGERRDSFAFRYWSKVIGDPVTDRDMLIAVSPRFQAAAATAPILLVHGESDTVVPIAQSTAMRDALTAAGKTVTFVRLDGEDHFLRVEKNRTALLAAIYEFLHKHNPVD